jgi:hypothetical protein
MSAAISGILSSRGEGIPHVAALMRATALVQVARQGYQTRINSVLRRYYE